MTALEQRACEADERLKRLLRLVEDGATEIDNVLENRIAALKADRDTARSAVERAR